MIGGLTARLQSLPKPPGLSASHLLDDAQRLELERRRLWSRLAMLAIPAALLIAFGWTAAGASAICVLCAVGSYGVVAFLLRCQPTWVVNGRLGLRLLDVCLIFVSVHQIHALMLSQLGTISQVFDVLYLLCIVAGAATDAWRGAALMSVASTAAIVIDRLLLVSEGLRTQNDLVSLTTLAPLICLIGIFFLTGSSITLYMRVRSANAARREGALYGEIESRNQELEDAAQELAAANDRLLSRRQLTADMAHELRNSLTTISGYVEAMRDGELEPTTNRLDAIFRQTRRLDELIGDLRLLSLADVGALTLKLEPVSVRDFLSGAAQDWTALAEEQNVSIRYDIASQLGDVEADDVRLRQALTNIVTYAMRRTPAGGEMLVSASTNGPYVEIAVRDGGAAASDEGALDPFHRFSGAGLGLPLARALIDLHGGSVAATGNPLVLTIRLPKN